MLVANILKESRADYVVTESHSVRWGFAVSNIFYYSRLKTDDNIIPMRQRRVMTEVKQRAAVPEEDFWAVVDTEAVAMHKHSTIPREGLPEEKQAAIARYVPDITFNACTTDLLIFIDFMLRSIVQIWPSILHPISSLLQAKSHVRNGRKILKIPSVPLLRVRQLLNQSLDCGLLLRSFHYYVHNTYILQSYN